MVEIAAKALLGGLLVVVFTLITETVTPKRFAGVFSAAPSIALASLAVTVIAKGRLDAATACQGMIAGALGFCVYALVAAGLLHHLRPIVGATVGLVVWIAVAAVVYLVVV